MSGQSRRCLKQGMDKVVLRKQALQRRETLAFGERLKKDKRIKERFLQLEEFQRAERIFFYASYRAEVDTFELISEALRQNKRVALPKVYPEKKVMRFYWIRALNTVSPGYRGIPEPVPEDEAMAEEADLVVVPAVAYNERGYRLGYGGGYYDRFLKEVRKETITVGLAYDEQIIGPLPTDDWDMPVDIVITEERTIYCHGH